jgi:putative transposase
MAEPPRLSAILLSWDKSVIYFVTICVKDRRKVLANQVVFEAIKRSIAQMRKWRVLAGVIMPDHCHWIVSPVNDRDLSVGDFAHGFKRMLRRKLGHQPWEWGRGCFDRLLRSDENLWSKGIYVRDNPVRQGLVDNVEDWPYYLDFINEATREAVSFPYSDRAPIQSVGVGGI